MSKAFLQRMDESEPLFRAKRGNPETGEFIPAELKTLERIIVLLLQGELLTDYDQKEAVKLFKRASAEKGFDTFTEMIVQRAIKQSRFNHSTNAFSKNLNEDGTINPPQMVKATVHKNAAYFLPADQAYCEKASNHCGLSVVGIDFDFKDFFGACTIANYATTSSLEAVEKIAHKGNGLVIIDKYILTDTAKGPNKIPHIIATVKKFMTDELAMKFELTIITEHISNDRLTNRKANEILEGLGGSEKLSFKLIATNRLPESDRYILSNYLSISVGHPWDRNSVLSSSSIISQDSKENLEKAFSIWKSKLQLAKEIAATTRPIPNVPNGAFVFETDGLTHKLLNLH
ncbi:hypothetical protein [Phnomibacter sp. MR]|uniref:hypothetical protein n=1 Tax=Phnomibacter sp. MR TaxID=3042318 RepID=UPI003A803576